MLCFRRQIIIGSIGRIKIAIATTIRSLAVLLLLAVPVGAQDLTLLMPEQMLAQGFDKQILPRFGFKHRIKIAPVAEGDADMTLSDAPGGFRILVDADGTVFYLSVETEDPARVEKAGVFRDWLKSTPGKAAIESFEPDGQQIYSTEVKVVVVEEEEVFDGDKVDGTRLALVHCGLFHFLVVSYSFGFF